MSQDSKYIPLSAREMKGASRSCILRTPKPKEDLTSTFKCIYPLSTIEEQTLDKFGEKHSSQSIKFDPDALMIIINNMFHYINSESKSLQESGSKVTEKTLPPENIPEIISQIRFDCDPEGGLPGTSFHILDVVIEYSWQAKVVLIIGALVTSYGEFCFEMKRQTAINPFAKQKRPSQPTRETISSNLTRLENLVKNILEVGTVILQFMTDKVHEDIADIEPKLNKVFHSVIYQTIKVGVACSSYMELVCADIKNITLDTEIKRQDYLMKELLENQKNIADILSILDREVAENFTPVEYREIQIFITKLFTEEKALNTETVIPIVLDGLKGYTTCFLISDVNASIEKFTTLVQTHHKVSKEKKIRIVWIPIVDQTVGWTDTDEKTFNEVAYSMPWCCCHPSVVTKAFSTHVVKNWQYKKEASLVVLNEQAEVITNNALSTVEMWGEKAFSSSSTDVITTISKNWTIKRMVEDWEIHQLDLENDIVCIYGGGSLEMTRSFSQYVQSMTKISTNIKMKAIYVGTDGEKEKLQNIVTSLEQMNVKCLSMSVMSSFWSRLATILNNALDNPTVKKQLPALLCYGQEELWTTMIYKGSTELIKPTGTQLLQCFEGFNGSNTALKTTDELWKCLVQITKQENLTKSEISASACKRVRDLFGSEHKDVSEVLSKVFIKQTGIFGGQTGLEYFKGKSVGFLVTAAKIEEFPSLLENYKKIYKGQDIKIIWIPIVKNKEEKSFQEKARSMKWYYCQTSMLTKDFATYIMQDCYSQTTSTLMVLNKHGKLVSTLQWDASTFPWVYGAEKELGSDWFQYQSAKELTIRRGEINVDFKNRTVYEYNGIREVPVDVLEIFAPVNYYLGKAYDVQLAPNTLYEIIFVVMLTEQAKGWKSPLCYIHLTPEDDDYKYGSEVIYDKPRGVWFEVKLAEFSLQRGQTVGLLGYYLYSNEYEQKGLMIKGAGIRVKKR